MHVRGDSLTMKRIVLVMLVALLCAPALFAQDDELNHGTVGVFANYTRLKHADSNFFGLGGRVGFNVHPNVQFEAELAYDFERNIDEQIDLGNGTFDTQRSPLRMIHGLFGPKFQAGTGAFRVFGTVKGGFLNFSTRRELAGQFSGIPNGDTNGVFYPGGGIEAYAGPIGVRFEVGDEIYFDDGANHNLRVTAGPQFRF